MTKLKLQPKVQNKTLKIDLLTLFPNYFQSPLEQSLLKRALDKKLLDIKAHNIRDFASNQYGQVDDTSYGGGPGMVLMPEPIKKAIDHVKTPNSHVIYLSPQGTPLTPQKCKELATKDHLILLCGHYEGIDERIIQTEINEEISIGDYILSSGCPAALVLLDATARFIPGVVGKQESTMIDSFENRIFDYPHYTKPPLFEDQLVPHVLLEGHHKNIEEFRQKSALEKTKKVRPDLYWQWQFERTSCHLMTIFVPDLTKAYTFFKKLFPLEKTNDEFILKANHKTIFFQNSSSASSNVAIHLTLPLSQIQKIDRQLKSQDCQSFLHLNEKGQIKGCTFEDIHGIMWHLIKE